MHIFHFRQRARLLISAVLVVATGLVGPAHAQSAGSLPLPPSQIVTGPVAWGTSFGGKTCPTPTGQCVGNTYPSISNGYDANQYILPRVSNSTLPYVNSTSSPAVVAYTTAPTQYVRFYRPDAGSNADGGFIVGSNAVRGLTPAQLKDVLALPFTPTMQTNVLVPAGTCLLIGGAGPILNSQVEPQGVWGNGGAVQEYLIGQSPTGCGPGSVPGFVSRSNFINQQALGFFALAYGPRAGGGNAGAVAFALDHAIPPALFSEMDGVYNALDLLNYGAPGPLRGALRQLDGEIYANVPSVVIGTGLMFINVLRDQTHLARSATIQRAQNGWRSWVSGFGGAASLYGTEDVHGVSFSGGGFAVGADYRFSSELQAGISAAYTRSAFGTNGISGGGGLDSYSVGSYVGYASGNVYLDGAVGYSYNTAGIGRSIAFPGVARSASASVSSDALLSRAEIGYHFHWTERVRTTPFASLQSVVVGQRGFSEQGAGAISLNVSGRTTALALSTLGTELSYDLPVGLEAPLTFTGRAGWAHDYADVNRSVAAYFPGALNSDFWVNGARAPRNAAAVGARLLLPLAQANLFIRYDGMFANNADISSATGGIMINF